MAALAAAEAKVTKALSLVPDHARGHMTLGFVEILTKRAAEGIAECEHALELDRNLANAHSSIGLGKISIGRAEETEAHVAEALRLSPRDTIGLQLDDFRGHGEAATSAVGSKRSRGFGGRSRPTETIRMHISCWPPPSRNSVDSTRRIPRSRPVSRSIPTFTVSRARAAWTAMSDHPTYLAQNESIFEGLRKAGVPEQ